MKTVRIPRDEIVERTRHNTDPQGYIRQLLEDAKFDFDKPIIKTKDSESCEIIYSQE